MIWTITFLCALLIPAMMIGFGWLFMKKPPKKINGVYGYRTKLSMKNQETWDFAHRHFGRTWFQCGLAVLIVTVIIMLFMIGKSEEAVGVTSAMLITLQMILLIGCIFPTERELRRKFDKK